MMPKGTSSMSIYSLLCPMTPRITSVAIWCGPGTAPHNRELTPQDGQRRRHIAAPSLDDVQQLFRCPLIYVGFPVRVDRFQVVNGVLDLPGLPNQFPRLPRPSRDLCLRFADGLLIPGPGFLQLRQPLRPSRRLLPLRRGLLLQRPGMLRRGPLSSVHVHSPGLLTVTPRGKQPEELLEVFEDQRRLLAHLYVAQVVVPDLLRGLAFREEEQVRLHPRACCREDSTRQTHHAP